MKQKVKEEKNENTLFDYSYVHIIYVYCKVESPKLARSTYSMKISGLDMILYSLKYLKLSK